MVNPCEKRLERAQVILGELRKEQTAQRGVVAHLAGRWAMAIGDTVRAEALFRQALQDTPSLRPAMRGVARVILQTGEKKKVLQWLDLQIRATSHPREAAALYRERGRLIEQIFGDIKATRQCHEAAILAAPEDLSVLISLFHTQEQSGDLEATGQALQKIADNIEDDGFRAVLEHAHALMSLAMEAPSSEILQRLSWSARYAPQNPMITHDGYRIAQQIGTPADALGFLVEEQAIRRDHDAQGPVLWRMANLLKTQGHGPEALALLRQASLCHPHRLHLSDQLLRAALDENDTDMAICAAIRKVRILQSAEAPWQACAWYDLAEHLLHRDRHDSNALSALARAVRLDPCHKGAGYRYLETLRDQEQYADFVEQTKVWCNQNNTGAHPSERASWLQQAANISIRQLGQVNQGHDLLKSALALDPTNISVRAALERVYHDEDDAVALRSLYREDLDNTDDPDRELILRTLLCHVVPEIQDPQRALEENQALLAIKPQCQATIQQIARLVAGVGDPTQLLDITLQESEFDIPTDKRASLIAQAGDISLRLQETEQASEYYRQALELDANQDSARRSLEALARSQNDHDALLDHLSQQLEQHPESAGLRLEIADLLLDDKKQASQALAVLTPLIDSPASSFSALRTAERILSSLQEPARALEFVDRRVGMLEGPKARAFWLLRSAWMRWRYLDDQSSALQDLWRASILAPEQFATRWILFELLAQQGSSQVWPWLRKQLQRSDHGPSVEPLVTRWLVRDPPAHQAVEWLSLDQARQADGPSQCLNWLDPVRRCQDHHLYDRILNQYLETKPQDHQDPRDSMMRYLAARAKLHCHDWEGAKKICDTLVEWEPGHQDLPGGMVTRVRKLHDQRKRGLVGMVGRLKHQRTEQGARAVRLHTSLWIIDLLVQSGDYKGASRRSEQLISTTPTYLPAHYLHIHCLEHLAEGQDLAKTAAAYLALAEQHTHPGLKAKALRAASRRFLTLAMSTPEHHDQAWDLCKQAFLLDPTSDEGFSNLWECAIGLDQQSADPKLVKPMVQRLAQLKKRDAGADEFSAVAALCERLLTVSDCVEVLEGLAKLRPNIAAIHLLLARALARSEQWTQAVFCVDRALQLEQSRKRKGALHYFLADMHQKCGQSSEAIDHYMHAANLDFRVDAAGQAAARLAGATHRYDQQVSALELMVDRGRRQDRPRYMRSLADLYRGPLKRLDRAIDLITRLVSTSPDDSDAVALLYQLLSNANRHQEAQATLRVATTRLQNKFRSRANLQAEPALPVKAVHGLRRFFELENETDGVYLATAVIEIIAPTTLQGPGCDVLRSEPWSLPQIGNTSLLPALLREIPSAFALRRLVHLWPHLPKLPELNRPIPPGSKTLSPDRDASRVVHTLGALLGLERIHVAVDLREDDKVLARWAPDGTPSLILGKRVYTAPIAPRSRDAIGRAVWRLATGGDCLRDALCERQRRALALLPDLMEGRFTLDEGDDPWIDAAYAKACLRELPDRLPYAPLTDVRERSRCAMMRSILPFDASLDSAEDRFGAICTGDPRIALALSAKHASNAPELYTDLIAYILSNAHIELRRELGYQHLVELDVHDLEVLPL